VALSKAGLTAQISSVRAWAIGLLRIPIRGYRFIHERCSLVRLTFITGVLLSLLFCQCEFKSPRVPIASSAIAARLSARLNAGPASASTILARAWIAPDQGPALNRFFSGVKTVQELFGVISWQAPPLSRPGHSQLHPFMPHHVYRWIAGCAQPPSTCMHCVGLRFTRQRDT